MVSDYRYRAGGMFERTRAGMVRNFGLSTKEFLGGIMSIRIATQSDWPAIWAILQPVFRAGETYAVDRTISADAAHKMWMETPKATFVTEADGQITGTYYIKTNAAGGGAHGWRSLSCRRDDR